MTKYILDGHSPVPTEDILLWANWYEKADRTVARWSGNGVKVSTVFLGLDHAFGGGPPMLFETMVFGGPHSDELERYSTWEEAEAGHAEMLRKIQAGGGA